MEERISLKKKEIDEIREMKEKILESKPILPFSFLEGIIEFPPIIEKVSEKMKEIEEIINEEKQRLKDSPNPEASLIARINSLVGLYKVYLEYLKTIRDLEKIELKKVFFSNFFLYLISSIIELTLPFIEKGKVSEFLKRIEEKSKEILQKALERINEKI